MFGSIFKRDEEPMAAKGVFFDLYGTLLDYKDMKAAWATWEVTFYRIPRKTPPFRAGIEEVECGVLTGFCVALQCTDE